MTETPKRAPISIPGMVGPKTRPQDYNPKGKWFHLIMNDRIQVLSAFGPGGTKLWEVPALARGQMADNVYTEVRSDTPPGVYKCGKIYRDYDRLGSKPSYSKDAMAYGWYSVDMIDLEGQERRFGRSGIMIHGGGSACGWPGAWVPRQQLHPTLGCIRVYNEVMRDVVSLCDAGEVFISVYQEK